MQKSIERNLIEETFENLELKNPNWESESAKIFARKKRLGIKYSNNLEKDLAKMARAGFNYKISKNIFEFLEPGDKPYQIGKDGKFHLLNPGFTDTKVPGGNCFPCCFKNWKKDKVL